MNKTWASGAIELIRHAAAHIQLDSAFDKRIAFISIDNAVEMMIRVYLSLPKQFFGDNRPSRKEMDECNNGFIQYLSLLSRYAGKKLGGIDLDNIEHYHRIRNTLYHDGTGLTVDQEYLNAYYILAKLLLQRLFNTDIPDVHNEASLEKLILNCNKIEECLTEILDSDQVSGGTFKWEEAIGQGLLSFQLTQDIAALRFARNQLVLSATIDSTFLLQIYRQSVVVLKELKPKTELVRNKVRKRNFLYEPVISEISGKLILESVYGPPGFGTNPENDQIVKVWVLVLPEAITVHQDEDTPEEGDYNLTQYGVDRIQVFTTKNKQVDFKPYENDSVTINGSFMGAHTAHHFTPVLMDVSVINLLDR